MADIIAITDLPTAVQSADSVAAMVGGANAAATRVAPCLGWDGTVADEPAPSPDQIAEAKLVLIGAVVRWTQAGSGAAQSQTAGPFGITIDTRQKSSGYRLWPSEIQQLQDICGGDASEAFAVDTVQTPTTGYWSSPYWFQED